MRRALARELLVDALGDHTRLPSPDELQRLLTEAEISLFTGGGTVDDRLLDVGWYLHAVAGARDDLNVYSFARRQRAHQVSAHIFDVFLQTNPSAVSDSDFLRITFAAQVGYLGGELTPNAAAMRLRSRVELGTLPGDKGVVSLQAGILLLALSRGELFAALRRWTTELDVLTTTWGSLDGTPFAAVDGVVRGCYDLLIYLVYGRAQRLESARARFQDAMAAPTSRDDTDSRWVAAQLHALSGQMGEASVWAILPPDPVGPAQSMTLGNPPVLLLWPPQRAFLQSSGISPLDRSVRRLALSFPTSAGKTLLAQLLVVSHIAASGGGDVCVVAPSHSLCREIKAALARRIAIIGGTAVDLGPIGLEDVVLPPARAVVMTPEKLAALVHNDPSGTLSRFSMFVIDEVHLLKEGQRGWALEETVSLLHHLTRTTHHRLVVLSAALGNRMHVLQWLDAGDGVLDRHDDWRGPRRLHAIFTTEPRWDSETWEPAVGSRLARKRTPLAGAVYLRGPEGNAFRGEFTEPVGLMVRRQKRDGGWARDDSSSTMREHLGPLVEHLAAMGQVLVVQATRSQASKLAQDVADGFDEHPPAFSLAEVAETRVGAGHPLVRVLRKGVAFHHGTLPSDLQAEIEDATRDGRIRVLVATTTLTEGVNLPFKTVLIAERGWGTGESRVEIIDEGRLLNAIGRAGRAGRETEGWLILSEQKAFSTSLFDPLDITAEDLTLVSTLAQQESLNALAEFESLIAASEDAVLANTGPATDGFCSYVWFLVEVLREFRGQVTRGDVVAALRDTLAWQQFDDELKARWTAVMNASLASYAEKSASTRRRWARAGTSLPSAALLESVADDVAAAIRTAGASALEGSIVETIRFVLGEGRLEVLLALPENRSKGFKRRITDAVTDLLPVDELALLLDWVAGRELEDLANDHLSEVTTEDYRTEQLSEFLTSVFEHHIPWTLGIVLSWVNETLQESGMSLSPDLPGYIHYGVPNDSALQLMLAGVRSRRLAVRVASAFQASGSTVSLNDWLAQTGIPDWRAAFDAFPTELTDLLSVLRSPSNIVADVLARNPVVLGFVPASGVLSSDVRIRIVEAGNEPSPRTLLILAADDLVLGRVGPQDHEQISQLLDLGVALAVTVPTEGTLKIELEDRPEPDDEQGA